jgi:3-hydroxybutyryl-CoA dehydrogenase
MAAENTDLISEAVPENLEIKKEFYNKLRKVAPEKTIFTTNTLTIIPSQLADDTGHPQRFLAMHFANKIWERNLVEIMGHSNTDPAIFETVVEFAREIGMVPISIEKEQPGYLLNTLLIPLLSAAGTLLVDDVAKAEEIDRAWMIGTGAPLGPFAFLDMIGMRTVFNVTKKMATANPDDKKLKQKERFYKEQFIDKGKLGVSTGEGFYKYPNPKFKDPDFLKV